MGILNDFKKNIIQRDFSKLKDVLEQYLTHDASPQYQELYTLYQSDYSLTGQNGIRRKLAALNLEFFGRAYFPHYFSRKSPGFHRELDQLWREGVLKNMVPDNPETIEQINQSSGSKQAIAAPRGHAKSTNVTFKDVMHSVLLGYKHYAIIISDASDQAEGFLENIRVELEENEAIREDFGNLVGNKVWRNDVLLTSTDIKLEAIGSGKKIRGRKHRNWRPDLLVLDDIENDENVRTPEQRKKLFNWFTKAVSKSGDSYTDVFYIGTILHYDSLLANMLKNPGYKTRKYKAVISWAKRRDLWDEWEQIYIDLENENHQNDALTFFETNRNMMLEETKVLWEEKLSYYDLMVMRVDEGESSFNSEEQNDPVNPEDCLFNEEWLDFYNPLDIDFSTGYSFYGFVDPSLGKKKNSDFSTIITLAKNDKSGYLFILDVDMERRHPDKIITDTLEKERWLRQTFKKGYRKFGCETNQFQWFLKEKIAEASVKEQLYLPIVEVNQISDKTARIETLQPDVKNKYIKFNKAHKKLLEQLLQFPMGAHDDGPDGLEACRTLAKDSKFATVPKYESVISKALGRFKGAY